jgi:hypothetical protein
MVFAVCYRDTDWSHSEKETGKVSNVSNLQNGIQVE